MDGGADPDRAAGRHRLLYGRPPAGGVRPVGRGRLTPRGAYQTLIAALRRLLRPAPRRRPARSVQRCAAGQHRSMSTSAAWPAGASSAAIPAAARANRAPAPTSAPATTSRAARSPRSSPKRRASLSRSPARSRPSRMCRPAAPSGCGSSGWRAGASSAAIPAAAPFEPCVAPGNRPYFRPNNNVTRGQLAKIVAGRGGLDRDPDRPDLRGCAARQHLLPLHRADRRRGASSAAIPAAAPASRASPPANRPYFRPDNTPPAAR